MGLFADVRQHISVPAAAEMLGLELPDRIPGHILCTAHDEAEPSLYLQPDHWRAFCCGVGGDVIDFVQFVAGASKGQAVAFLSGELDQLHEMPVVEDTTPVLQDLGDQLERETDERGLADAANLIQEKWPHLMPPEHETLLLDWGVRVGSHNLLIPHTDAEGIVRGVKTRSTLPANPGKKRALPGSTFTVRLYRVLERPWAWTAWLVEGESDTWTLSYHFQDDPSVAVYGLPSGAQAWKPAFRQELERHRLVLVATDPDETGEKAAQRILGELPHAHRFVLPAGRGDVTEAYLAGWVPPAV